MSEMKLMITTPDEAMSVASAIVIKNNEQYEDASSVLRAVKTIRKAIDDEFNPGIKEAHLLHQSRNEAKKVHTVKLDQAEKFLKDKIGQYTAEQERIRLAEQRRLEEVARKAEEARMLEEAAMLESMGEKAAAEEMLQDTVHLQAPVITMPKLVQPTGISTRSVWAYRVVNENLIPREYLSVDHTRIGKVVTAMKGSTNIPGIQTFEQKQVAARAW